MSFDSYGGAVSVNTTTANQQRYGDIAALEGGGTIVVWEETNADGTGTVVRAQRLTETGAKFGGEITVSAAGDTTNKGTPSVAGLEDGGFVVTWYDVSQGVLAQRYDGLGVKVGAALTIDATPANFLSEPSVTAMLGGGYAVSWQRANPNPSDFSGKSSDVFAQIVDADGGKVGGIVAMTPNTAASGQYNSATAGLVTGGTITVWKDDDGTIKAQRLGSTGVRIDSVFTIGTDVGNGGAPSVVALTDGYAVVWSTFTNGVSEIKARLFTDSGTALGEPFTVATGTEAFLSNADIAAGPDGGFTVSWQARAYSGSSGFDVVAQSYTAGGTQDGVAFPVNSNLSGDQTDGRIVIDRDGRMVAIWTDAIGGERDIKGQVFDPKDAPPVAPTAQARPATAFDAGNATLVDNLGVLSKVATTQLADGGYVVLWSDIVGETQSLRGQRFDSEGKAAGDRFTVYAADKDEAAGYSVTALDTGGFAVAWQRQEPGSDDFFETRTLTLVYGANGQPAGSAVVSGAGSQIDRLPSDVEGLSDGSYVLVTRGKSPNETQSIVFQRHAASGAKLGGAVTVATSSDILSGASATALEEGGFLLTWTASTITFFEGGATTTQALKAQFFENSGRARGAAFEIAPSASDSKSAASALALTNGTIAVAWSSSEQNGKECHLQLYSKTGAKIGVEIDVAASGLFTGPTLTALPDGRFLMTWDTIASGKSSPGQHFGQLFDANGAKLGLPTLLFETDNYDLEYQLTPRYVALDNGDIVAYWGSLAPTSKFDANGNLVFETDDAILPIYTNNPSIQSRTLTFQNPVTGNSAANTLTGTAGSDRIAGLGGTDTLRGLDGDDVLIGGAAGDRLEGGAGVDTASYATAGAGIVIDLVAVSSNKGDAAGDSYGSIERYVGSRFADVMQGDARANHFDGGLNNDFLFGLGGADTLVGGLGDDVLEGGTGVDTLDGGIGIDAASYAKAKSGVTASLRAPSVNTGEAAGDTYRAIESLIGSAFADTLRGDNAQNRLDGGAGNDTLFGDCGDDFLFGGTSNDTLDGGFGADRLEGGAGNDSYVVDNAADRVVEVAGGGTQDTVTTSVTYALLPTADIEVLRTADTNAVTRIDLTGSDIANFLYGDAGTNTLDGRGGADKLYGLKGNDTYIVDDANDLVYEIGSSDGTRDIVKASVSYTLRSGQYIEELRTTNDAGKTVINLTGNEQANTITGNAGSNVINGGLGKDLLIGDGITDGIGRDTFVFSTPLGSTNVDRIADFNPIYDLIHLENSGSGMFTALAVGTLKANEFKDIGVDGAKVDADDHILYNRVTGSLSYDADGSGSAKAIQFAILNDSPDNLTYRDFIVI